MSVISMVLVVIVAFLAGMEGVLDEFQFHQPLVACTLIGLVTGQLVPCIILGGSLQMIALGWANIGAAVAPDAALAAVASAIILVQGGQGRAGVDTAIAVAIPLAVAGLFLTMIVRTLSVICVHQMDAAAAKGVEKFGEINVACCNAGVCRLAPFEEMDDKTRDFHIDVNIKGVWNTCKAVIPYMLKQGGGNIVIASSVTGDIVADAGEAAYAMTKAALVGLTKCLAVEYASRNIRVNCSQLGYARTPMVEKMAVESNPENPEAAIADIAVGVPMKRLAKPIEVGELFAFLGSDESSYLTGSQIVIDGGSTLPETMTIGTN